MKTLANLDTIVARAPRCRNVVNILSLTLSLVVTQLDLGAQSAPACPPQSFVSNVNLVANPDFEAVGPCGPVTWIAGVGSCNIANITWSAAQSWRLHGHLSLVVQSTWEVSTLPIGGLGRMLHIQTQGPESGVIQPFALSNGVNSIMFSVWVKVIKGQVAIAVNSMANGGPLAYSTKRGEWEELRVCTNGTPVDLLSIYNENWATGDGDFYVDRVEVRAIN